VGILQIWEGGGALRRFWSTKRRWRSIPVHRWLRRRRAIASRQRTARRQPA